MHLVFILVFSMTVLAIPDGYIEWQYDDFKLGNICAGVTCKDFEVCVGILGLSHRKMCIPVMFNANILGDDVDTFLKGGCSSMGYCGQKSLIGWPDHCPTPVCPPLPVCPSCPPTSVCKTCPPCSRSSCRLTTASYSASSLDNLIVQPSFFENYTPGATMSPFPNLSSLTPQLLSNQSLYEGLFLKLECAVKTAPRWCVIVFPSLLVVGIVSLLANLLLVLRIRGLRRGIHIISPPDPFDSIPLTTLAPLPRPNKQFATAENPSKIEVSTEIRSVTAEVHQQSIPAFCVDGSVTSLSQSPDFSDLFDFLDPVNEMEEIPLTDGNIGAQSMSQSIARSGFPWIHGVLSNVRKSFRRRIATFPSPFRLPAVLRRFARKSDRNVLKYRQKEVRFPDESACPGTEVVWV